MYQTHYTKKESWEKFQSFELMTHVLRWNFFSTVYQKKNFSHVYGTCRVTKEKERIRFESTFCFHFRNPRIQFLSRDARRNLYSSHNRSACIAKCARERIFDLLCRGRIRISVNIEIGVCSKENWNKFKINLEISADGLKKEMLDYIYI